MMATASAVATPDSPDISMPSQPSGLSSAKRPALSPTILSNEVTESPGIAAASAAPFSRGVVIFIAMARGAEGQFEIEITGTIAGWSRQRRFWFNAAVWALLSGGWAAAIA